MIRSLWAPACLLSLTLGCGDKDEYSGVEAPNGGAIYSYKCSICHGESGDLNSVLLSEIVPTLTDAELEYVIREGTDNGMPAALVTDDAEVQALIHYMRDTWGG